MYYLDTGRANSTVTQAESSSWSEECTSTCLELDAYGGTREMIVLEVLGVVIAPSLRPLGNADAFRSDCYSYCVLHIHVHLYCFLISVLNRSYKSA